MRVRVSRMKEGVREIMVIPGRARGMPPVVIRGADRAAVRAELRKVIGKVRGEPGGQNPSG